MILLAQPDHEVELRHLIKLYKYLWKLPAQKLCEANDFNRGWDDMRAAMPAS
jgi:hypothetical protein